MLPYTLYNKYSFLLRYWSMLKVKNALNGYNIMYFTEYMK
jgi:hypothetical protein